MILKSNISKESPESIKTMLNDILNINKKRKLAIDKISKNVSKTKSKNPKIESNTISTIINILYEI